jgi:hypothetical protein
VVENRSKKLRCDALSTVAGYDVHAPEVHLVRGLDVPIAVETRNADEARAKGTEYDALWRAPQVLANRLGRTKKVVVGRSGERERRIQQSLASDLDVGLRVGLSQ